jgi:hypothetical protein
VALGCCLFIGCGGVAVLVAFGKPKQTPASRSGTWRSVGDANQPDRSPQTGDDPPSASPSVAPSPGTASRPSPKPASRNPGSTTEPAPEPKAPAAVTVRQGAACSPEGAIGFTAKGTRLRCTRKGGEPRFRWRFA